MCKTGGREIYAQCASSVLLRAPNLSYKNESVDSRNIPVKSLEEEIICRWTTTTTSTDDDDVVVYHFKLNLKWNGLATWNMKHQR